MKQPIIQAWDDLYLAEGSKVEATEERKLTLNGHAVTLDLTAEHAKELDDQLSPWLAAGVTISTPKGKRTPKRNKAYYDGLVAWAEATNRKLRNAGNGRVKYMPEDRADYDAYLAGQSDES